MIGKGAGKIKCSNQLPPDSVCKRGCVVYLKEKPHRVSHDDGAAHVIMMQLKRGAMQHLRNVVRHAFFPLLSMSQSRKGLTNAAVADFSYAIEEFVCGLEIVCGKMQGEVVLPVPTRCVS